MFDIDKHEKKILVVGYRNKIIETKDKWNQLNILDMQYMLGNNCRRPLLHTSKSYIWIEETNERINQFSIGYIINPNFHKNKAFKEQLKGFLKKIFGPSINIHIGKILLKKNTRVLALVMLYENGGGIKGKFSEC